MPLGSRIDQYASYNIQYLRVQLNEFIVVL